MSKIAPMSQNEMDDYDLEEEREKYGNRRVMKSMKNALSKP